MVICFYSCYSYIGRIGGPQEISIGNGCDHRGIVLHEIFHALGRWHEQSRPDRDNYIRVNFQNMDRSEFYIVWHRSSTTDHTLLLIGVAVNFEKVTYSEATTNSIAYDFRSLMHYSAYAFSRNGQPTIQPLSSSVRLRELGQRESLSNEDLQHALALYCSGSQQGNRNQWLLPNLCLYSKL